jgi:hypothetical protein
MAEDRLQSQDTFDERRLDDVLDEGATAPDHPQGVIAKGVTDREQLEGETIDDRLSQEVPDPSAEADLADHDPSEGDATTEVEPAPTSPDELHP